MKITPGGIVYFCHHYDMTNLNDIEYCAILVCCNGSLDNSEYSTGKVFFNLIEILSLFY